MSNPEDPIQFLLSEECNMMPTRHQRNGPDNRGQVSILAHLIFERDWNLTLRSSRPPLRRPSFLAPLLPLTPAPASKHPRFRTPLKRE